MAMREIILDADRLLNKGDMGEYMSEVFPFPEYFGKNLSALRDLLSEVNEDTDIILTRDNVRQICASRYAYKVMLVLSDAAEENPHLRILFR
jgi:RNAse (barnase) inhibitor barstar